MRVHVHLCMRVCACVCVCVFDCMSNEYGRMSPYVLGSANVHVYVCGKRTSVSVSDGLCDFSTINSGNKKHQLQRKISTK